MLVAQQKNGEIITLTRTMEPELLKQLQKQKSFFCPQCQGPLTLKVGRIKIPHFAHQKNSTCEQAFSEGETLIHVLGKQQLFSLFQSLAVNVKLEHMLAPLTQRPDLFIEHENRSFAIEFQYSSLPPELFERRTAGYLSANIHPIWIVNTPKPIVAPGIQKVKLTAFYQLFLQPYKNHLVMMTYCPKRERFFYVTPILHVHKQTYICTVEALPISQQSFPFLMPKQISFERFRDCYMQHKECLLSYLQATIKYSKQGTQNLFLRYLYELRLSLAELPAFLRCPIIGNESMQVVASGWQCAFFYFVRQLEKFPWELTMNEVQLFFTCMKIPYNVQTVQVLRSYVRICRELHITSHRVYMDEERWIQVLYRHLVTEIKA